ncbi:MAG TPA: TonB-dependent receptor [Pyrinomonadaceae bacterium]|nr:TonB-dependent receptor [Pyrinomonadaceae bacterium]
MYTPVLKRLLLLTIMTVALSVAAKAQDTVTGAFEGIVTDSQTGAALKSAEVEIINQQTGLVFNLRTDSRGRFFQGLLLPGLYTVRVAMRGYQTKEVSQRLRITYTGEVVPVPVALDPAPTSGTPATPTPAAVEDTDIRATLVRTDGRRSGSFSEEEVVTLPLGGATVTRTFDELALLLPGIAPPPQTLGTVAGPGVGAGVGSAGQFSANGLRSRGNNFTVDGSDNNDEDIGVRRQGFVALVPQPIESIQEYQVITLLAPAQFGRNIGAQVNAVSKSGGSSTHGTVYGMFNSSQLNARNFFDTAFGTSTNSVRANNQDVLVQTRNVAGTVTSQQPLTVQNQSGDEDSLTFGQAGFVLGGPIHKDRTFYFVSFEEEVTNATKEESFAVPTVEQRGAFGTGATGIFQDPFTGEPTSAIPTSRNGAAIFSLYPFPNNPNGVYGSNTFTQVLPASGRGTVISGKIDHNFRFKGREQSVTGRYNFTDDWRYIPATGGAIYSTLKPEVRTQNFSFFLNSKLSGPNSDSSIFNQIRLSYGRTRLRFDEVRETEFLIPSNSFPGTPFLLNAPELLNVTQPLGPSVPNNGQVVYVRQPITVEQEVGPLGQVTVAGFSPLGVDVFNFPQRRVNNTYQFADQLTMRVNNHSLTFGTDNRRTELNSELPRNSRPLVTFSGSPRLVFENGVPRFPTSSDPNPIVNAIDLASIAAPNNLFLTLSTGGADSIDLRYYQWNFYGQDDWRVSSKLSLSYGLRYEYNTPLREINNLIENTFNSSALSLVPGLNQFLAGRTQITNPDRNNLAPRVGVAYSPNPFSRRRLTVIRVGYGIFFDQILGAVASQSRNVFPSFFTLNFGGGPFTSIDNEFPLALFNPARTRFGNVSVPIVASGSLNRLNPQLPVSTLLPSLLAFFPSAVSPTLPAQRLQMPSAQHYALTWEQQLSSNLVISSSYTGTRGSHLLRFVTPNLGAALNLVPTVLRVFPEQFPVPEFLGRVSSPARPVLGLGAISIFETTASSRYDSLQLQIRGRFRRSFQYQANYVLSKTTDDVSDVFDLAGAFALPQNSVTRAGDRGPANFDVRHRSSYSFIYSLPELHNRSRAVRVFFSGMQITSTGQFQTGQPFTVNSTIDVNQDGNLTDRLNTTSGLVVTGDRRQPLLLTTTNTLSLLAPFGQDGIIGRNTFRVGSIFDFNLSIAKNFSFSSSQRLTLRTDLFNVPNRINFGIPIRFLEAPGFGQATSTTTPGRRVQFSLKYLF